MTELTNLGVKMDVDEAAIDEGLYSRQLWALISQWWGDRVNIDL